MNRRVGISALSPLMTEVLQNGGEVIFTIMGSSMLPLLHHGRDRVCLVEAGANALKKYDMLLFIRENGKYILHRIVAIKKDGFIIVGDNQHLKEYPVLRSQVLGVVKGFWRNGKYIPCDQFWYRVYCRLWVSGYPARWLYLKGKHFLGYCFRRLLSWRRYVP